MYFYVFKCFCNVSIYNLGIKLGLGSGKSSLCTLLGVTFQGQNLVYIGQIVYLVHLTCETGEIKMYM